MHTFDRGWLKGCAELICVAVVLCFLVLDCWAASGRNTTPKVCALRIGYYDGSSVDYSILKSAEPSESPDVHICTSQAKRQEMLELKKNDPEKYKVALAKAIERMERIVQARKNRFRLVANEVALAENLDLVIEQSGVGGKDWLFANGVNVTQLIIDGFRKHRLEFDRQAREADVDYYY